MSAQHNGFARAYSGFRCPTGWRARVALALACGLIPVRAPADTPATWLGASGSWHDSFNWDVGVEPNLFGPPLPSPPWPPGTTFSALIDTPAHVDITSGVGINNLTLGPSAVLDIHGAASLNLISGSSRAIHNSGLISLVGDGASSVLHFGTTFGGPSLPTVTLDGGGVISLGYSEFGGVIETSVGTTLVNLDNTIHGGGTIAVNLTNSGTINANSPLGILLSGPTVINKHIMQASVGSSLGLAGGTFTNTGAVIQAVDPMSNVLLGYGGATTVKGGSLATLALDSRIINVGTATLDGTDTGGHPEGIVLSGGGLLPPGSPFMDVHGGLYLQPFSHTKFKGTITNTGVITLAACDVDCLPPFLPTPPPPPAPGPTFISTTIDLDGDVLLAGAGTVQLSPSRLNAFYSVTGSTKFTIGADQTIQGSGQFGSHSRALSPTLQNKGTIIANAPAGLVIYPPPFGLGFVKNLGTMKTAGPGTLFLESGTYFNSGALDGETGTYTGTILAAATGTVRISGALGGTGAPSTIVTGGNVHVEGLGSLELNTARLSGVTLVNDPAGFISALADGTNWVSGDFTNHGFVSIEAASTLRFINTVIANFATGLDGAGKFTVMGNLKLSGSTLDGGTAFVFPNGRIQLDQATVHGHAILTNLGVIEAISGAADNANLIDSGTADLQTNHGLLQAVGGAALQLRSGIYDNSGGVILADAGSKVLLASNVGIASGILRAAGSGRDRVTDSASLAGVTIDGAASDDITALILNAGSTTTLLTSLTVNFASAIQAGENSGSALIKIGNAVTLSGSGELRLVNPGDSIEAENGLFMLTVNPFITIQGAGKIGNGKMALTNTGTIRANVAGQTLEIQPNAVNVTNSGTIEASVAGSTLTLNGGIYDNTGGTIGAGVIGSEVRLTNMPRIAFGTLGNGPGIVRNLNNATLSNLTIAGPFVQDDGATTMLNGIITNNSSITLNSAAGFTDIQLTSGVILDGAGTVQLNGPKCRIFTPGNSLEIGANQTIQGGGLFGLATLTFSNAGTIRANNPAVGLVVAPIPGGDMENTGTIEAAANATLTLDGGVYHNAGGTIKATLGSTIDLKSGVVINNGTLGMPVGGVISNATVLLADAPTLNALTFESYFSTANGSTTFLKGTIENNGFINLAPQADLKIIGNVTLDGIGELHLARAFPAVNGVSSKTGDTRLTIGNDQTVTGDGLLGIGAMSLRNRGTITPGPAAGAVITIRPNADGFDNQGKLDIGGGTTINVINDLTQTSGESAVFGTLDVLEGDFNVLGGIITGRNGLITGSRLKLKVGISGIIQPGPSSGLFGKGTLNVKGLVQINGGGTYTVDLGDSGASDLVNVTGDIDLTALDNSLAIFQQAETTFNGPYIIARYTGTRTSKFKNVTPGYSVNYNNTTKTIEILLGPGSPQWNVNGGGIWGAPANWIGGVPDGVGKAAGFLGVLVTPANAPAVVTLDAPRTVGTVVFDNATTNGFDPNSYILAGSALTLDNSPHAAQISVITGAHTIASSLFINSDAAISVEAVSALTVSGPATLSLGKTLTTDSLGSLNLSGGLSLAAGSGLTVNSGALGISTIGGTGSVTINEGATLTISGSAALSTLTVHGAMSASAINATGAVSVGSPAATLTSDSIRAPSLTIHAGSKVSIDADGTSAGLSRLSTLTFDGGPGAWLGTLDLNNNDLIIQATPLTRNSVLADLTSQIASARNAIPAWSGDGITSSAAAADLTSLTGLGILLNDNGAGAPIHSTFDGESVDTNSILIKYTWNGDTDLSGIVDADDYFRIDSGFASAGALGGWINGDFDYSGGVDADDYFLIDSAFAGQTGPLGVGATAVPEPGVSLFAVIIAFGGIRRRRKR